MGIAGGLWRVETRVMPWISFWPNGSADGCRNSHCTRIGSRRTLTREGLLRQ
jgi:hypothetical protein